LVNVALNGGAAADILQLAQPATIKGYGEAGQILDVATIMDAEKLSADLPVSAYQTGDSIWAIPYKIGLKSVVWYPIKAFADRGYEVPTTWDELVALSDRIIAEGEGSPWCIGIDSGSSTGWVITDWIEDIMIRTAGLDATNAWATGELPFSSPEVKNAFFPDAKATGSSQFVVGEDVGLFYFPMIDESIGAPVLFAGDAFMVTQDRPEVRAVAQFLATPESIEAWVKSGSAISANNKTPVEWSAGNYKLETAASLISAAPFLVFDSGDVMPSVVGSGTFWTGPVDWIAANGENTDEILQMIDDSWPAE
jgi:alpha-glucoside transport system substrate-binding protein